MNYEYAFGPRKVVRNGKVCIITIPKQYHDELVGKWVVVRLSVIPIPEGRQNVLGEWKEKG